MHVYILSKKLIFYYCSLGIQVLLGVSQYGDLHFGQTLIFSFFGIHLCPHLSHWYLPHRYEIKGKRMLDKWMNVIGIANEIKLSKYLVWKEFGVLPPYTTNNKRVKMLKSYINPQKYYKGARSSVG